MKKTAKFLTLAISLYFCKGLAQKDTCNGRYQLAQEYYTIGRFKESLTLLEQYRVCLGGKNSDYYKLKAHINIANDDMEAARENLAAFINSEDDAVLAKTDAKALHDIYEAIKDSLSERQITSVSKIAEDVDLTPATVVLIKEQEFVSRGYNDLVDLLADQPGFDISKIQGINYAQIYQRGFRQENTERTLLLINGIEENDAWSNIAYVSRQYPLSDISSVEIIYGPASTVYGPRAFVGAINIITKSHRDLAKARPSKKMSDSADVRACARIPAGTYQTRALDMCVSARFKKINVMLTTRYSSTVGPDMSQVSFLDYKAADLDNFSYNPDNLVALKLADTSLLAKMGIGASSPYRRYFKGYGNSYLTVNADSAAALAKMARQLDKSVYSENVNGRPLAYSNTSQHYFINARIKIENFEAGFRIWKCHEGYNFYQDVFVAGSANGSAWEPRNTTFYTLYRHTKRRFTFMNTNSYAIYSMGKQTRRVWYNAFYNLFADPAYPTLSVFHILFPDSLINGYSHGWANKYFYYQATQYRNDTRINYSGNRMKAFMGFEFRSGNLQGDFLTYENMATKEVTGDDEAYAQSQGTVSGHSYGSNIYKVLDAGFYGQANIKIRDSLLTLVAGSRLDYNGIRNNEGFGLVINPKLALVFARRKWIAKLVYASGLQSPSNWTKFSTGGGRTPNGDLRPEEIKNFECILQNRHRIKSINWHISAFYSTISNAISSGTDPSDGKKKNLNSGEYDIAGLQVIFNYLPLKQPFSFYYNLTYNYSLQTKNNATENFTQKKIGDIAPLKSNLVLNYHHVYRRHRSTINLRLNYVGARPVGPNTTVSNNSGLDSSFAIPAYLAASGALIYENKKYDWIQLQLVVNNITNGNLLSPGNAYYHPGPRTASANYSQTYQGEIPWVPQNGRHFLFILRLVI